jgi:orotidine-5'-phosphate decarboxylase
MVPTLVTKGKPRVAFVDKLIGAISSRQSRLCIGLDPELNRLPEGVERSVSGVIRFNREIIVATSDLVCAYKPNFAFYEALGERGLAALRETRSAIPSDVLVIGDAKRGDIGNTARAYASAIFDWFGFDAVTVNPYLGEDSIEPFRAYTDRGVFVVCRTSNPGAQELQNLRVSYAGTERMLYEVVALRAREWNARGNVGLVVGATAPAELECVRALAPELPLLIPAVGAQGGDVAAAARAHRDHAPAVVSASRSILFASSGRDFADVARSRAIELRDSLQAAGQS